MTVHEAATDYAVPTGDFIAEWLEDNSMRASELAARMGVSRKHVSKLLAGASLTPEVATKLELVTGVPASRWLALEALYRTDLARLALEARLEEHAALLEDVPLTDLRKRGFVTVTRAKPGQALRECMAFFRVGDVSALADLLRPPAVAFRQSSAHPVKWGSVATWLRLGELAAADEDPLDPFDSSALRELIVELRALSVAPPQQFGTEVVRRLAEAGVRLVYVPEVAGARAYGATRWIHGDPVVQLSLRGADDGHFWFTLFHELGHVLCHPHNEVFVRAVDDEDQLVTGKAEAEADRFAGEVLIPVEREWELATLRSRASVIQFANEIGVSPGVVVGRLHHDAQWPYKNGRDLYRRLALVESD